MRGSSSFRIVLDDINIYNCVPNSITVNNVVNNESVENGADGTIAVSPTGGIAPYSFVWSTGDTNMGSSSTLGGLTADSYTVTVTDAFGCFTTETFNIGVVSTQDLTNLVDINLYPNPVKDVLTLDLSLEKALDLEVYIYNSIGQQLWFSDLPSSEEHRLPISVNDFSTGLYFLQVRSDEGQVTKRFVIDK